MPSHIELQKNDSLPSSSGEDKIVFGINENSEIIFKDSTGGTMDLTTDISGIESHLDIVDSQISGLTQDIVDVNSRIDNPLTEVTYSELVNLITGTSLTPGSSYMITDFQTCYDVPEYYVNSEPKIIGSVDYKQSNNEPIVVFATSNGSISSTAYQPAYPNDKIQYDWTWDMTEINQSQAYGRITERIDEYGNRTDYDHRTILFNRFESYQRNTKLTGSVFGYNSEFGEINGNGTLFLTEVSPGDVLLINYEGYDLGVKVISASTDNDLFVVVDSSFSQINFGESGYDFYNSTSTGNYNEYKEVYVGQKNTEGCVTGKTFNLDGSAVHNYVGDYSKFYIENNTSNSGFLLANNIFYSDNSGIYSNTIGDRSYNNTARYWFVRNTIAGRFYNNVIHNNGFYSNSIGEYFNDNIIKDSMYTNTILEGFNNNKIDGNFYDNTIGVYFENNHTYSQFNKNTIGNSCSYNDIYSDFYENKIGLYFSENVIGDLGNLGNFNFYRNVIGNNFAGNYIRQTFQNNQIGNEFNNNTANGNFYKNVIGNGFEDNQNIGYDFYGNHIGNGFNNNELIGDYFYNNTIGEYFENNSISYLFNNNQIGNQFENNTLGDTQYFNWDNTSIENLTGRSYNTFYESLYGDGGNNIGNVILGKELIMNFSRNSGTTINNGQLIIGETYEITDIAFVGGDFSNVADVISGTINTTGCTFIATGTTPSSWCGVTVTELTVYNEYHRVKFNQWTQNQNGGGFSYERTKVFPSYEPTVYFTKLNYEDKTDFIILGRLEIVRNNGGAIFNQVEENSWNQNVSPEGTQWNSIYTQPYNGSYFQDNTIINQFKGNYIRGDFQINTISSYVGGNHFSGNTYSNIIGDYTFGNDFLLDVLDNSWMSNFHNNTIGDNFEGNTFNSIIEFNIIGDDFQGNNVGSYFSTNTIGNNFGFGVGSPQGNKIGNNFRNNTVGEYFYNNIIPDGFTANTIGNLFQRNNVSSTITSTDFTTTYGNIIGFTYDATGTTASSGLTITLSGTTNNNGINASFDIEVSGGEVISVIGNNLGNLYNTGDTITILGTQIGGVTGDDDIVITVTDISETPSVYESYLCNIFERKGGDFRLSYYDETDTLTITDITA